jgi:hypothetical protein
MTSGTWKTVALAVLAFGIASSACLAQVELYSDDFEAELPGTIPVAGTPGCCYKFYGPTAPNETTEEFAVGFSHEISSDGVGGSQAYKQNLDGTNPGLMGGPGYFYTGVGAFAVFGTPDSPLAGGEPGSNDPSRYRFSADIKVEGAVAEAPVIFAVTASDIDYEAAYLVDANGDGDIADGAGVYRNVVSPVLTPGVFQTISFTLDEGTIEFDAGVLPEHRVFSNGLSLLIQFNWGAAEFGLDANNIVTVDNILMEFLPIEALPGDYNGDGFVDAADYTVWRNHLGEETEDAILNNGNGMGGVDSADYLVWKDNYGEPGGEGGGGLATAVPEPSAAVLMLAGILFATRRRRDYRPSV